MKRPLQSVLESFSPFAAGERAYIQVPITVEGYESLIKSVSRHSPTVRRLLTLEGGGMDCLLDEVLLRCVDGDFIAAEKMVFAAFAESVSRCAEFGDLFRKFLTAFFIVQRVDVIRELIDIRYSVPFPFDLVIDSNGPGLGRLRWDIETSGRQRFTFYPEVHGPYPMEIFCHEFPLFINYGVSPERETGSVIHNQWDVGRSPGIAYSDSRPDYFLVPDLAFVGTKGYDYERNYFRANVVNWDDKSPVAFWRGSTTGHCNPGQWRELERVKLCQLATEHAHTGLFDVGLSGIVQMSDPEVISQIEQSGLMRGRIHWEQWNRYKYHIDIDGNANAWSSVFQKLLTASPILKIGSYQGFRQWYYDDLIPWHNYVPVAPSMWDLVDKIKWLRANDSIARQIGQRGLELANKLTYSGELARSVPVITAAFRYFNEHTEVLAANPKLELDVFVDFLERHGFNFQQYIRENRDLSHFPDTREAANHLILYGFKEGRKIPVRRPGEIAHGLDALDVSHELKDLMLLFIGNFAEADRESVA